MAHWIVWLFFSSSSWLRVSRLLESWGEILPLSNTGDVIKTGDHACLSTPLYTQGALATCCFKSCTYKRWYVRWSLFLLWELQLLHVCWQAFVNSHARQFDLHKQLGFAAITWKLISPSVYISPTLGEDRNQVLENSLRVHFANSDPHSTENTNLSVHNCKCIQ